jgi:hypothetical protein
LLPDGAEIFGPSPADEISSLPVVAGANTLPLACSAAHESSLLILDVRHLRLDAGHTRHSYIIVHIRCRKQNSVSMPRGYGLSTDFSRDK